MEPCTALLHRRAIDAAEHGTDIDLERVAFGWEMVEERRHREAVDRGKRSRWQRRQRAPRAQL